MNIMSLEHYVLHEVNPQWIGQMTQYVDYLANPQVSKKNSELIMNFIADSIDHLNRDPLVFKSLKSSISRLRANCYYLNPVF